MSEERVAAFDFDDKRPAADWVILIDGNSLVYRAHYALIRNPLRTSRGVNTSAAFGFVNFLRSTLERFQPRYIAVVFDAPGKTFRHELFERYKIQRPKMPPELMEQMPVIKQLVSAFGIRQFEFPGVEADDVLATLAMGISRQCRVVCLVSSDKDLLQLVGDKVVVFDPAKEIIFDRNQTRMRLGVEPDKVVDLLALSGDAIDNIPGVPGIGEKRAQEIVLRYGSVENAAESDPRVQAHRERAILSKDLARLRTNLDFPWSLDELAVGSRDDTALQSLLRELEFSRLLAELYGKPASDIHITLVKDISAFVGARRVALTVKGANCHLASETGQVLTIPLNDPGLHEQLLRNHAILKIGFDLRPALKLIPEIRVTPIADLMIAAWLLDANVRRHNLEGLSLRYLGQVLPQMTEHELPVYLHQLYQALSAQLEKHGLAQLFTDIEMPLEYVLSEMELRGVKLDAVLLDALSQDLSRDILSLSQSVQKQAGVQFNINSPAQLSRVLFETMGLKPKRRTLRKTGYSTDAAVLNELALTSSFVADILKLRELQKLLNTYLVPLAELCRQSPRGRVHTTFNQTGTATGRLSTSNPNLQNIPVRAELGRKIRRAFIPDDGNVLISADYSQIELRVLAEITGDENLRQAFATGQDVHNQTAAALFQCPIDQVTPAARRVAKMVNYGIIYGMSDYGLADRLRMTRGESQAFIAAYLALYPGIAQWVEHVVEETKQTGYARTLRGRIRPIPDLNSSNRQVAEAARRAAINTPIQGTAADIIKQAMIVVDSELTQAGITPGLILQIHDELLIEAEASEAAQAMEITRSAMLKVWQGSVPLEVEVNCGANWGDIH